MNAGEKHLLKIAEYRQRVRNVSLAVEALNARIQSITVPIDAVRIQGGLSGKEHLIDQKNLLMPKLEELQKAQYEHLKEVWQVLDEIDDPMLAEDLICFYVIGMSIEAILEELHISERHERRIRNVAINAYQKILLEKMAGNGR